MQVKFFLAQDSTNRFELNLKSLPDGITQDQFTGGYLFPAMLHLIRGASYVFDATLPVGFYFEVENADIQMVAQVQVKSKSVHAIRKACLALNEALAYLSMSSTGKTIYELIDMKANRGAEFRTYAKGLLRPSVSLASALSIPTVVEPVNN